MGEISSNYFIPRDKDLASKTYKRVRLMPLYSFPCFKYMDWRITEHTNRYFIHFDLDAFYAQVEQRDNPKYKGVPVGVVSVSDSKTKGIVMTASYEARAVGIDTAMSTLQALQIYPDLVCIPCYGQKYEAILLNLFEMIKQYVPDECIEQYSIDECFIDLSPVCKSYSDAIAIALEIKANMWRLENLTTSMGLSYNKTYAKMATKMQKPDGFTVISKEDREEKVYPLSIGKIWGIGKRIELRFNLHGIHTIKQLAESYIGIAKKEFGINGIVYHKMARGEDTSGIFTKSQPEKMLMHQHSLTNGIYEEFACLQEIRRIAEYLGRKLRAKKLSAKRMMLVVRYDDLDYYVLEAKLSEFTNDERILYKNAVLLYAHMPPPHEYRMARMFGMSVFELESDLERFNFALFEKRVHIPFYDIDRIKEKYGEHVLRIGVERQ
jgi:DNA polymerase-4